MANSNVPVLSLVTFAAFASAATAGGNPVTIETEKVDQDSYRLQLQGGDFRSAHEGQALLTTKAAELCAGEPYSFGQYSFTYTFESARNDDPEKRNRQLTQDVHCGVVGPTREEEMRARLKAIDKKAVMDASRKYFRLRESGLYKEAYAFAEPLFHRAHPFESWHDRVRSFHSSAGDLDYRRVYQIRWSLPASEASAAGARVDLDSVGGYANSRVLCTHHVWHEQPDGSFMLVNEKEKHVPRESYEPLANECSEESDFRFGHSPH